MKTFIVLDTMSKNRKINMGMPIVALIESDHDDYIPIALQSNLPAKKELDHNGKIIYDEKSYEGHAEWLCIDEIEQKIIDGKIKSGKINLWITTTPCDHCAKRIIDLYEKYEFVFKNVYYFFNKHNSVNDIWREIKNISKFIPTQIRQINLLSHMENHWVESNLSNRQKTLLKFNSIPQSELSVSSNFNNKWGIHWCS